MNPLFTISEYYKSPSNISIVFADNRPDLNINPDHLERWLHKTDRLEVISDTWMRSDGEIQGGNTSTMTMEDYWESEYVMQDLYTYIVVHSITDPLDIGKPLEKIVSEYVHKVKRAI